MEYLLGGLVVVAVLAFVVLPLVRRTGGETATVASPAPAEERAAIYRELLELELDQRVGKVTEADYKELSEALLARAAALISVEDAESTTVDAAIEHEIAAMRQKRPPSEPTPAEEARS